LGQKYADSRKRVDAILAREPNHIEALLLLATLLGHDENLFEAENVFKKVIEIDSRETRAYLGLARVLAQQGQTDGAERALLQAVTIEPQSVKNRMALFSFHVSQRKFDKAEAEIRKIVADNPGHSDLLITMGSCFLSLNRNSESEAAYNQAIEPIRRVSNLTW
jgi:Flp pilus assembly protein TadD